MGSGSCLTVVPDLWRALRVLHLAHPPEMACSSLQQQPLQLGHRAALPPGHPGPPQPHSSDPLHPKTTGERDGSGWIGAGLVATEVFDECVIVRIVDPMLIVIMLNTHGSYQIGWGSVFEERDRNYRERVRWIVLYLWVQTTTSATRVIARMRMMA